MAGKVGANANDDDVFLRAQERLRQHRLHADLRVREDQVRMVRRIRFAAGLRLGLLIMIATLGVLGPLIAPALGVAAATLAILTLARRWPPAPTLVAIAVPTLIGSLAAMARWGMPGLGQIAAPALIGVAAAYGLWRWQVSPGARDEVIAAPDPDGERTRGMGGDDPLWLRRRGERCALLAGVGDILIALRLRDRAVKAALSGAAAGFIGSMLQDAGGSANSQYVLLRPGGVGSSALPAYALCALVGGAAAFLIAWREWNMAIGMLLYGLGVSGASIIAVWSGMQGFAPLIGLWVWSAWVIAGAVIAWMAENATTEIPQRST